MHTISRAVLGTLLVSAVRSHTFLKCTHYDPSFTDDRACNSSDNWPYYKGVKQFKYTHSDAALKGKGLCTNGNADSQDLGMGTVPLTIKAGQSTRILWANNGHTWKQQGEAGATVDPTNRFAYVWHAYNDDPTEAIYLTTPVAQFDWMYTTTRTYEYQKDFDIPESADKQHFGYGNLTVPADFETGLHTMIFAWRWVGNGTLEDPGFDHATCFQLNVINDVVESPSIKTVGPVPTMTKANWQPVWVLPAGAAFVPVTGLSQTLDAQPTMLDRDAGFGGPYSAFTRQATSMIGAVETAVATAAATPVAPPVISKSDQPPAPTSTAELDPVLAIATAAPAPTTGTHAHFTFEPVQPMGRRHDKKRLAN